MPTTTPTPEITVPFFAGFNEVEDALRAITEFPVKVTVGGRLIPFDNAVEMRFFLLGMSIAYDVVSE